MMSPASSRSRLADILSYPEAFHRSIQSGSDGIRIRSSTIELKTIGSRETPIAEERYHGGELLLA